MAGSKNLRVQQRSGQQGKNMSMTLLLITEQSTLEYRYTQTSGFHYLRATLQKSFDFSNHCMVVYKYIFYSFLYIYLYIKLYSYLFLHISIFILHTCLLHVIYFFLYQFKFRYSNTSYIAIDYMLMYSYFRFVFLLNKS